MFMAIKLLLPLDILYPGTLELLYLLYVHVHSIISQKLMVTGLFMVVCKVFVRGVVSLYTIFIIFQSNSVANRIQRMIQSNV